MKDERLEKILESIQEKMHAPKHRTALRAALMREHARVRQSYFPLRFSQFITMKTALIPVSTFAVLAIVLVGTLGVTHKSAEAQELVERSMARAVQIPAEMRAKIEAQLKADMMQTLEEAYRAPDLRILSREEYEKEAQFTIATSAPGHVIGMAGSMHSIEKDVIVSGAKRFEVSSDEPGSATWESHGEAPVAIAFSAAHSTSVESDDNVIFTKATSGVEYSEGTLVGNFDIKQPVKYLRYTDPEGRKVTLGLDESDTPVFRIEELTTSDIIPGPDGTIGIKGKVLRQIQVHTENFDGGYGSAGAIHIGE